LEDWYWQISQWEHVVGHGQQLCDSCIFVPISNRK
jgi:hypothetical protein